MSVSIKTKGQSKTPAVMSNEPIPRKLEGIPKLFSTEKILTPINSAKSAFVINIPAKQTKSTLSFGKNFGFKNGEIKLKS